MTAEKAETFSIELLRDFVPEDAAVLIAACQERLLVAGEELFAEGDRGGSIWIVKSGGAEVYTKLQGKLDRVLESLGPGDSIGEMTFLEPATRSASIRTTETSEFLLLTPEAFSQVERERPAIAASFFRNIARITAQRLRATTEMYREAMEFSLESSGAAVLNLKLLSEELRAVTVHLLDGSAVEGVLLVVDHHAAGYSLVLKSRDESMKLVPYHAVLWIEPSRT
jgi:CRP-like cAMP-binding protein